MQEGIVNPVDVRHLGRTSESEVLGKNDFYVYPKELAERFYADDQKVIQTGQPIFDREEYVIDEKGQKIWLSTTKLPLRNENNQITGLVGIGHDITEKMKAEEERKKAEEERERLINELQEAVADIKVLSGLVPICSIVKKSVMTKDIGHNLRDIYRHTHKLNSATASALTA